MKALYNTLSKPAQNNRKQAMLFCVMISVIGFATTLFAGAFFVKAIGVAGVLSVLAVFGVIAGVGQIVVNVLDI